MFPHMTLASDTCKSLLKYMYKQILFAMGNEALVYRRDVEVLSTLGVADELEVGEDRGRYRLHVELLRYAHGAPQCGKDGGRVALELKHLVHTQHHQCRMRNVDVVLKM